MIIPNPHIFILSNLVLGLTYGALIMFFVGRKPRGKEIVPARYSSKKTPPMLTDSYELVKFGNTEVYVPRSNKSDRHNNVVCELILNAKEVPTYVHWLEVEDEYLLAAPQK
jgi:hypothetical protein